METLELFQQIDKFLALARTVDRFSECRDVYQLFGISEDITFAQAKAEIEKFKTFYQGNASSKYKDFKAKLFQTIPYITEVLREHRDDYNRYLRDQDPRIDKLRVLFGFCTSDGTLNFENKSNLIEEGKKGGLLEPEICELIDRWIREKKIKEVVSDTSSASTTPFDRLLGLTFYEILGIPESASQLEIDAAYKVNLKKYNENRDRKRAEGEWAIIVAAYNRLKDPIERKKYDLELHTPTPPPPGTPILTVERKSNYTFTEVRKGTDFTERIVVKNPAGGMLQGTITSDAPWLEPSRNKLLEMHEQELYISIFTSKIPPRTYKVEGKVTIDTNGGKDVIPFQVVLQSYNVELTQVRKVYIPLFAAVSAFIFSFPFGILGFLIGGCMAWCVGFLLSKQVLESCLDSGVNLSRFPVAAVNSVSVCAVGLALMFQFNSWKTPSQPASRPVPAQSSSTTATAPAPRTPPPPDIRHIETQLELNGYKNLIIRDEGNRVVSVSGSVSSPQDISKVESIVRSGPYVMGVRSNSLKVESKNVAAVPSKSSESTKSAASSSPPPSTAPAPPSASPPAKTQPRTLSTAQSDSAKDVKKDVSTATKKQPPDPQEEDAPIIRGPKKW